MRQVRDIAKGILDDRKNIIEKFMCFDADREDFLKEVDPSKMSLLIVYILMDIENNSSNRPRFIIQGKDKKKRILDVIEKKGRKGASIGVIANILKTVDRSEIERILKEAIESGDLKAIIVTPKRGASTMKYFPKI